MSETQTESSAGRPVTGMLDMLKLFTPDVRAAIAFYRDVMGAVVAEEAPPHWARVRLANVDIGLHLGDAAQVTHGAGWEPGFRVHDVAAFRAHLERRRVTIVQDFHDIPGGVTLAFADPAGNVLSVVQYGTSVEVLTRETP